MYSMYIQDVPFPVTPGKITYKIGNNNKTVSMINEGTVNLIKSPGLTEITIDELLIPAVSRYPFAVYEDGKFRKARYYLNKLEKWKGRKKPVSFRLCRTTTDGRKLLWDTDFDVTIESYEITEDAGKNGMDFTVKLSMKQYKPWGTKRLKLKKDKNGKKKAKKEKGRTFYKDAPNIYVVKQGDKLTHIAKKQLGDASRWKDIYSLNEKAIENAARKNGRKSSSFGLYLYAGTKLNLPESYAEERILW